MSSEPLLFNFEPHPCVNSLQFLVYLGVYVDGLPTGAISRLDSAQFTADSLQLPWAQKKEREKGHQTGTACCSLTPDEVKPPVDFDRGVPLSGDSDHFWRDHPPKNGTGL